MTIPPSFNAMHSLLSIFSSRIMALMLLMGFVSGLPLALTAGTLQAWLTDEGVSLAQIGLFSLVGVPYSFKFAWAPLLDRFALPVFGRRRGWMLISQLLLIVAIVMLGSLRPSEQAFYVALSALIVTFLSATQDIAIDAYRADILKEEQRGAGAALAVLGYRIGMLTSGALALILADRFAWASVYYIMAAAMGIGIVATFFSPKITTSASSSPTTLRQALTDPFFDFLKRSAVIEILIFVVLYKIGDVMAASLTTTFMLKIGFSKTEIGAITKGFGLLATICGGLFAGALLPKLGIGRALLIFGILQALSTFSFAVLAYAGKNDLIMAATIAIENFCGGLGTTALVAFLMGLCSRSYTATQYALLSSLTAVPRTIVGAYTGYLAEDLGWVLFFVVCTFAAVPALLMLGRFDRWQKEPKSNH